jgi:hypothetical protein
MYLITNIKLNHISVNPKLVRWVQRFTCFFLKGVCAMTRFVHINYPTEHAGASRLGAAVASARQIGKDLQGNQGLAGVLLVAMLAALIVVADQLVDTWADGHLLVAWVALWLFAFSMLSLLVPWVRKTMHRAKATGLAWTARISKQREDDRMMALARQDPRIMADIGWAKSRD